MNTENTSEKKNTDSVLEAFEKSYDSDEEFRKRWMRTVEEAKRRKEERLLAEEARLKLEEEKKRKAEISPRVTDEAVPGKPLDLAALAKVTHSVPAEKTAQDTSEKQKTENDTVTVNKYVKTAEAENTAAAAESQAARETEKLDFDRYAALAADNEFSVSKNDNTLFPSVRDSDHKMDFREKLKFRFKKSFSKDGLKRFAAANIPQKGDGSPEIVRKCVRGVSLIALVCALVFLGNYYIDFLQRIKVNEGFADTIEKYENIPEDKLDDEWAKIKVQYPDVEFPEGMNIKFSELYAINQNVVGWLTIPNTKINTVLLQSDDNIYHLHRNIFNEYTRFGNPYVNCKCKMGKSGLSTNTILYGHNANDGLMFHDLIQYMTVEGYLKSPVITLDTLYEQTKWKIFAAVLTNSLPNEDNGNVWQYKYTEFNSPSHFKQVLKEIDERTIIRTGVDVNTSDKIMTLYTCCSYQIDSGRLAVFARQLRDGESEEIDSSRVYYNSNAHYPQEWYTRKNKVNPFADPTEATTGEKAGTTAKNNESTTAKEEKTTLAVNETTTRTGDVPVSESPGVVNTTSADTPPTEASSTDAPATDAPSTDAASTDAPATDAPATDAPPDETPTQNVSADDSPASEAAPEQTSGT